MGKLLERKLYEWSFTNWLMAVSHPFQWRWMTIYRVQRRGLPKTLPIVQEYPKLETAPKGPLAAAWATLRFPHVHHMDEYED